MAPFSRRNILAFGAAGGALLAAKSAAAATFGNPDSPPQGAINANPGGLGDPGPQTPALADQFPTAQNPPATDVGSLPQFWSSFNNVHKRIQDGGWAREVTQADFAISDTISGVNMRLGPGGIREMHWHQQSEWGYMTDGSCRVTILDKEGRAYVSDVGPGDLWFFPAGQPHSLQGLGPDGCEFLIAFDDGRSSEFNTLLVTDWIAHTPPEVLAKNFGLPAEAFAGIPLNNKWIFQGEIPGPLAADQQAVAFGGTPPYPFTFKAKDFRTVSESASGSLRLADSTNFTVANTTAGVVETIKPGGLRALHWHPNADEWQYYLQGQGRMGVFNTGPSAQTADFHAGDIGYVKKGLGHYIENTGDQDLILLAVFRTAEYQEVNLANWLTHTPTAMVAQTLNLDPAVVERIRRDLPGVLPG